MPKPTAPGCTRVITSRAPRLQAVAYWKPAPPPASPWPRVDMAAYSRTGNSITAPTSKPRTTAAAEQTRAPHPLRHGRRPAGPASGQARFQTASQPSSSSV